MRASLSPLSPAEQTLAEQNFYMVNRFLSAQRLSSDEWFDVVIFRYLLTVKNWFRRPEMYKNGLTWGDIVTEDNQNYSIYARSVC